MTDKDKFVNIADLKAKLRYWCKTRGMEKAGQDRLMETIKRIPYTVKSDIELTLETTENEAEPIICCKDCAFWESKRVSCEGLARCRTGESGYRYRFGYDFCSRAQRREEAKEDEAERIG